MKNISILRQIQWSSLETQYSEGRGRNRRITASSHRLVILSKFQLARAIQHEDIPVNSNPTQTNNKNKQNTPLLLRLKD